MARMKNRRSSTKRTEESVKFVKSIKSGDKKTNSAEVWVYGLHAVAAVLSNPDRIPKTLLLSEDAIESLAHILEDMPHAIQPHRAERKDLDAVLPFGAVHQGAAVHCAPLPDCHIDDIPDAPNDGAAPPKRKLIIALDQVTDPQNVGAILRSAAAFGALAVVVTDRNSPETSGLIAKASCGAVETVPVVRVTNLSRAIDHLKGKGYWCVGLDGTAEKTLAQQDLPDSLVLIMGAEGAGLRRMSKEHCDFMAKLPIRPAMESLNVSNALAISLYELLA